MEAMMEKLKRLGNEAPTIFVGVWALERMLGVDVDEEVMTNVVTAVESVIATVIWFLVRRNTDGPITALNLWHSSKDPGDA